MGCSNFRAITRLETPATQATFLLPPYPLPLSTPATQAKFIVVSGRKDGVDLVLIYRYPVIFIARFG